VSGAGAEKHQPQRVCAGVPSKRCRMNTTALTARFAAPSVAGLAIPANDSVSTPPREATANDSAPIVKVLTLDELLLFPFPKQEPILAPWLTTQSLAMIHAWRGVGKTHVALNIAMAI